MKYLQDLTQMKLSKTYLTKFPVRVPLVIIGEMLTELMRVGGISKNSLRKSYGMGNATVTSYLLGKTKNYQSI